MKTFKGGVHVPDGKYLTSNLAVEQMPVVPEYFVSLSQHIGAPATPLVSAGDLVAEGQLIAASKGVISANVHSPVSGEVLGIEKRPNKQGVNEDYVHIKADGKGRVERMSPLTDPTPQQIVQRVAEAGIVGLGGAGFPTSVKLSPRGPVDTLIINAAECEPYLNCDNRLMLERADEVKKGIFYLAKALGVENIVVGVEANKMDAYNAFFGTEGMTVELLRKKYPQGAEKTLIYALTKRKVPCGALPADVGVVVQNVATAYAVYEAVELGIPLYRRFVTISGRGVKVPKNLEVRVGTSVATLIDFCGGTTDDTVKIVAGGPMMGNAVTNMTSYTVKTDSGFLALTDKEASLAMPTPCINCGKCASVCPMHLMPMYVDFYASVGDFESAVKYGAKNCFECGTCAYVCPAKRQIVQSVRLTKLMTKEKK